MYFFLTRKKYDAFAKIQNSAQRHGGSSISKIQMSNQTSKYQYQLFVVLASEYLFARRALSFISPCSPRSRGEGDL
jgi:hypothetical protein